MTTSNAIRTRQARHGARRAVRPDVAAPPAFAKALKAAAASGDLVDATAPNGVTVTCYPPKNAGETWRVYWTDTDGAHHLRGGREPDRVWSTVVLAGARAAAAGRPQAQASVAELVDGYLAHHTSTGWAARTVADRRRDLSNLTAVAGAMACADLTRGQVAAAVQRCGTARRGRFVNRRIAHLLAWGHRNDYLTAEQAGLADLVEWRSPSGYTEPPSRRALARRAGTHPKAVDRGDVPTPAQVNQWAAEARKHYRYGDGMIQTAAATGLRLGELLACTADAGVAERGEGNLVDLDRGVIAVRVQATEAGPARTRLPKANKTRDVVLPRADKTPTGFDLRAWLAERTAVALAEQRAAKNPRALLFPAPRGGIWWQGNLDTRVTRPTLDALGWPTVTTTDANGLVRVWHRFSFHSLRDRYACTAVDSWGYKESQLYAQGGWEDLETVRRYYYGADDDTHASVVDLIG